jgi:thymidylate synthase
MNQLDLDYQNLLKDILDNGVKKETRNGGTLSVFGRQIRHKMSDGFPAITTKKLAFKTMVTELIWFLRGDTNIKYLVDNNCHIWDGDAYKNYERRWETEGKFLSPPVNKFTKEEFVNEIKNNPLVAKELGELGPVYGKQWRSWGKTNVETKPYIHNGETHFTFDIDNQPVDQITNLISELKTNPDSRRLMVNAWNVGELDSMVLPPCHYGFQVYTRELSEKERLDLYFKLNPEFRLVHEDMNEQMNKHNVPTRAISLMYNCRSQDVPLGTPFNISSYALLLEIIAKQVNMVSDQLIGNLGDCHIYLNQIDGVKEQLTREPYPLPTVKISDRVVNDISEYTLDDIILENYQSHPTIKMPLSN